jgi:uncharacterized protein
MRVRSDHPRPVRTVEHVWIELPDGCRLAARMWLPEDAEQAPVPAVLDAVPYRKGDGTAARDATRYPYIAGDGYACVRLDLRGSGDSEGLIADEYTVREQEDVEAVIAWLAAQPWCDGAVGMIGVSWGGFAALQAAARNPPALRGIVAIHAADDRYADDVHYIGGCVLASDMVHWSACMTAYVGQPPDPAVVGEGWRGASVSRRWSRGSPRGSRTSAATTTGARARRASATRRSRARCSPSAAGSTATATRSCGWPRTCARRSAG